MLGLVRNQEREDANIAATQNSPPLDLLGEIWGGGFALLLGKRQKEENYYKRHFGCHLIPTALHSNNSHRQLSCDRIMLGEIIILSLLKILEFVNVHLIFVKCQLLVTIAQHLHSLLIKMNNNCIGTGYTKTYKKKQLPLKHKRREKSYFRTK